MRPPAHLIAKLKPAAPICVSQVAGCLVTQCSFQSPVVLGHMIHPKAKTHLNCLCCSNLWSETGACVPCRLPLLWHAAAPAEHAAGLCADSYLLCSHHGEPGRFCRQRCHGRGRWHRHSVPVRCPGDLTLLHTFAQISFTVMLARCWFFKAR